MLRLLPQYVEGWRSGEKGPRKTRLLGWRRWLRARNSAGRDCGVNCARRWDGSTGPGSCSGVCLQRSTFRRAGGASRIGSTASWGRFGHGPWVPGGVKSFHGVPHNFTADDRKTHHVATAHKQVHKGRTSFSQKSMSRPTIYCLLAHTREQNGSLVSAREQLISRVSVATT
jgi:hypothetical protein